MIRHERFLPEQDAEYLREQGFFFGSEFNHS
jgi:hypothetical protein